MSLIRVLRAELESVRADADAVRSSIRYRLGDVLLQALPLSFRSLRVIPKLLALLIMYRRNVRAAKPVTLTAAEIPAKAMACTEVVYKPSLSQWLIVDHSSWHTNNEATLLARLDAGPLQQLVLYAVTEPIARRLARLHWQGCRVVLHSSIYEDVGSEPWVRYAKALCAQANGAASL